MIKNLLVRLMRFLSGNGQLNYTKGEVALFYLSVIFIIFLLLLLLSLSDKAMPVEGFIVNEPFHQHG
jgi:hypothetical protein